MKFFSNFKELTVQVEYVDYMEEVADLLGCRPRVASRWFTDPSLARVLTFHGQAPYQYRLDVSFMICSFAQNLQDTILASRSTQISKNDTI